MGVLEFFIVYADVIESLVISIAVLLGGIWTIYTFGATRLASKAKAELNELNHKLTFTPLLNIDVIAKQLSAVNCEEGFILSVVARINNIGTRKIVLFFPESRRPLSINRIEPKYNGDVSIDKGVDTGVPFGDGSNDFSRGTVVGAGARVDIPFVVKVKKTGLYLVSFSTAPALEEDKDKEIPKDSDLLWTGRTYINVLDNCITNQSKRITDTVPVRDSTASI